MNFPYLSGYQDSNLGPPAPKAGALAGLRYTPIILFYILKAVVLKCDAKVNVFITTPKFNRFFSAHNFTQSKNILIE